jgi:hypothetical protein
MGIDAPRIAPRTRWLTARSERDFAILHELVEPILARNPKDLFVHRRFARLCEMEGNAARAQPHWAALVDADPADFEAAFHLMRNAVANGADPAAAAVGAAPAANDCFHGALVDALAEPAPVLQGDFKHIAICGASFCGSTLVDRLLGGLPGVRSIGESHWITKVRLATGYGEAIWSEPLADARFVPCTVCGGRCVVLTPAFRRSLAADAANWYRKIAARLDTRMLISADKNLRKLVDHDPLLELSALVIFKSPEQAWRSHLDKLPADREPEFYTAACRDYMAKWHISYRPFLDHFKPQGEVVFLNFDAFTRDPEPLLRALCERLGLPYAASVLTNTVPGHAIGGNGRSMRRLRDKDYGVEILPLPDAALDPEQAAIISADEAVQATWREMFALHSALAEHAPG